MNDSKLRAYLNEENRKLKIITAKETASTNDDVRRLALCGEPGPLLYIAEKQTAGKGRKGRTFFSPVNTGVYMSILIRPELSAELCTLITPLCAVAATEAIESVTGVKTDIKWVNDIFVSGKKVGGILTEGSFSQKGTDFLIIGIGINLAPPEKGFPQEIKDIAGSITENSVGLHERLIAEIFNRFMYHMKGIKEKSFLPFYKSRLFFLGKEITVISSEGDYKATATDIDSMCRLIVCTSQGERKILNSGEISVRLL